MLNAATSTGVCATTPGLLLLRLGTRISAEAGEEAPSGPLRSVHARTKNSLGIVLGHAPCSYRNDAQRIPRWILHCRKIVQDRVRRKISEEREQYFVAMGYFALTVMRRWSKWSRRRSNLRRLFEHQAIRGALRHWKHVIRLGALLPLMHCASVRGAWRCWRIRVEHDAAMQAGDDFCSLKLLAKGWRAWINHHVRFSHAQIALLLHRKVRNAFHCWRNWQQRWRTRLDHLRRLIIRKELKAALNLWRLGIIASTTAKVLDNERRRRHAALSHVLRSVFLIKCLRRWTRNACVQRILGRLVQMRRIRTLRDGMATWKQRQTQKVDPVIPDLPSFATPNPVTIAKPRKRHCRCVYDVCRGQRCTCAPRLHLLRRVNELHRIVAKGLSTADGGYRLVSHVSQCVATTTSRSIGPLGENDTSSDRWGNSAAFVEGCAIPEKRHRDAHGRKKYQTTTCNSTATTGSRQRPERVSYMAQQQDYPGREGLTILGQQMTRW